MFYPAQRKDQEKSTWYFFNWLKNRKTISMKDKCDTHYPMCFWFKIIYFPSGVTNVVQLSGTLKKFFFSFNFPLLFKHQAWKFHHLRETIYRYQNIYSAETTERSFVSMESNYQQRRGNNGNDLQDIQFFISSIRNVDLM